MLDQIQIMNDTYWIGTLGVFGSARNCLVTSPETDEAYHAWQDANHGSQGTPWPVNSSGEQTSEALDELLAHYGLPPTGLSTVVPNIPQTIALWRAKAVLSSTTFDPSTAKAAVRPLLTGCTNLLAAADALVVAQANAALTSFWASGGDLVRSSAALAGIASSLNLSSATIDSLFVAAQDIPPL